MQTISSHAAPLGSFELPSHRDLSIMMMPFVWQDVSGTILQSQVGEWKTIIQQLCQLVPAEGIGYLTIDERVVPTGSTHRRPGIHVDGNAVYGGTRPYAATGMILLASSNGTEYWEGDIKCDISPEGEVTNFPQIPPQTMKSNTAYACTPMMIHRGVEMPHGGKRQLLRLSLPSDAPYHIPYTHNMSGIVPTTIPGSDRSLYMSYREMN